MPGGFWNEKIAISAEEAGLKYLFTSKPGINYSNNYLLNLKRIGIRYNTQLKDIQRYCDYKINKELARETIFQIPRRAIGIRRYSLLRRVFLGEKSNALNKIFDP